MKVLSSAALAGILTLIIFNQGCKKETGPAGANGTNGATGATGATGSTGPYLTGSIYGFIDLNDQYGDRILIGNDSVLVGMDGTSKFCYTDVNGKYHFDSLNTGVYNFSISKSNYGSTKIVGLQYVGGGDVDRDTKISVIPNFAVSSTTDSIDIVNNSLVIIGTLPTATDTRKRTGVVFIGSTPSVSSATSNYLLAYSAVALQASLNNFTVRIPLIDLQNAGFTSGSTVYFAAYGASANFASTSVYEDSNTGRNVFSALSPMPSPYGTVVLP